ncbi:MAG TPA: transposase [Candidatus Saccharimonadales bacterium]|nr:transposase [Candidatus Saccharimonadales bacterium]
MQVELFRHGGRRRGAGRKPVGACPREGHDARPGIDGRCVMHVVLKVRAEVGRLRKPKLYGAIRRATISAAKGGRIRICHLSIQHDHVHLLVEAESKKRLADGMLGFQVSAARQINNVLGRRGKVFADRYHLVVIGNPTQMRNAIAYVLNNFRKHGEAEPGWMTDPYASGRAFEGWRERTPITPGVPTYGALEVARPRRGCCGRDGGEQERSARMRRRERARSGR